MWYHSMTSKRSISQICFTLMHYRDQKARTTKHNQQCSKISLFIENNGHAAVLNTQYWHVWLKRIFCTVYLKIYSKVDCIILPTVGNPTIQIIKQELWSDIQYRKSSRQNVGVHLMENQMIVPSVRSHK